MPYPPHKARGLKHLIKDYKECPEREKKGLIGTYRQEKAAANAAKRIGTPNSDVKYTAVFGTDVKQTINADACAGR